MNAQDKQLQMIATTIDTIMVENYTKKHANFFGQLKIKNTQNETGAQKRRKENDE